MWTGAGWAAQGSSWGQSCAIPPKRKCLENGLGTNTPGYPEEMYH